MVTLKPNMYVRYKYHNEQKIGKVDFIIYNEFADENFIGLTNNEGIFEGKILKASFNIIDLIEVGDYVNGYKIDYTNLKCETPFLRSNQPYRVDNTLYSELIKKGKDYNQPLHFYNDDIKSILTKEQFNSMKYVVERDK